ncbi:MAG: hypothetical protein K2L70_05275 [Clostridia bacterium]|nr:hypothetical protein [Clostridia bacterium]
MKSFKSKKSKVLLTCLAVILIVSILCVTLAGCKKPLAGETPLGVYFVGDFQKDVSPEKLAEITRDGEEIVSIATALNKAEVDYKSNPAAAAAAIYATAVTNYNNVTQTGYYVLTDALVNARGTNVGSAEVGIRSTYSSFTGKNGSFSQTVSGVTKLEGLGSFVENLRSNFGYNIQSFNNSNFSANKRGPNGGAQFPSEADDADVYKYILGAYNRDLSSTNKGKNVNIVPANQQSDEKPLPEYEQPAGAKYPDNSTLAGKTLPSFNKNREAWEPLNRIPARYWDGDKIIENHAVVEGTRYSYGTYGAGFAVYDFSRPEYLSDDTKVTYDPDLDLWTVEVAVKSDFVQQACEFAAGDLVKDTKDYIGLKNAAYTEISCKFEVYGDGLIKSMQKRDVLNSNEKCPLTVAGGILGDCKGGGTSSNTATMAFSYSDSDTDANRLAALYWPELGAEKIFKDNKADTSFKLDLSGYDDFNSYKPVVNDLLKSFKNLFEKK